MRGFFDIEKNQLPYKSEQGILSCVSCGLYKDADTPKMEPQGEFYKKIMLIGNAPCGLEDKTGKLWQGKEGRILQRKYKKLGVDIPRDCLSLNAVNCCVAQDKAPDMHQVACCRKRVVQAVKQHRPRIVILHGDSALESLIGYKWSGGLGGIAKWSGVTIPDHDLGCWICPTYHPSFVLGQEEENEVDVLWEMDIQRALTCLGKQLPETPVDENVKIYPDGRQVLTQIRKEKPEFCAFDIETTGLKPYDKKNHQIVTISFCWDGETAHAFPFPQEERGLKLLRSIMENPGIGKIAANMKYEDTWLNVLHDITVQGWAFDTMQAAHLLDNRPGITGLKFQAYVNFGIAGYDDEVSPYLKGPEPNTPNRIMELADNERGMQKLLLYNGYDSLLTFRLAMMQMKRLGLV